MKFSVKLHNELGDNTLTYSVLLLLDPLIPPRSIILIVNQVISTFFFDYGIGWINSGTFGAAHTFHSNVVSESSLPLSCSVSDSSSRSKSSSLLFGLSTSPFQISQLSVSQMLSGELSSSLSAGWWSIHLIQQTFNTGVRPPGRSFADQAGGTGDFSDNLNAAAQSCRKCDQDALRISSVSEMYPTAVICLF